MTVFVIAERSLRPFSFFSFAVRAEDGAPVLVAPCSTSVSACLRQMVARFWSWSAANLAARSELAGAAVVAGPPPRRAKKTEESERSA